jgi:hypothetical protein
MNELTPSNVYAFFRRFQFRGGRLRRFAVRDKSSQATVAEVWLSARDSKSNQPVRMRLLFDRVEEYRFQRRPGMTPLRLKEVQVGFFGDLVYVNLDPFPEDGPPKVMDFRASDCFLAGRVVRWELIEKTTTT